MNYEHPTRPIFTLQAPALLNQATPVNGTWYDILATTKDVGIYQIGLGVEDANETLEIRTIIDGVTITGSLAATHSTNYFAIHYLNAVAQLASWGVSSLQEYRKGWLIEGRSVQVSLRKTTATGAGNLIGVVLYGVKENA